MRPSIFAAASVIVLFGSTAFARGFGGINWPKIEIPGLSVPPIDEWKIGGTIGSTWEGNKSAIAEATLGAAILGPFGLVYGFIEGHATDEQRQAALKLKAQYAANAEVQEQVHQAALAFPDQASDISQGYSDSMTFFASHASPSSSFDELNSIYWEAGFCLISALNLNSAHVADDCKFDFAEKNYVLQKKYR